MKNPEETFSPEEKNMSELVFKERFVS